MRRVIVASSLVCVLFAGWTAALPPTLTPSGQADFGYGAQVDVAGGPATSNKPESKLFYTADGQWWAVLGTAGGPFGAGVVLYRLGANQAWEPIIKLPGSDPWAKADVLLDGATLYVSLRDNRTSGSGGGGSKPAKPPKVKRPKAQGVEAQKAKVPEEHASKDHGPNEHGAKEHTPKKEHSPTEHPPKAQKPKAQPGTHPQRSTNSRESRLYVLSYGATGAWTLISGPTPITTRNPESLTLARDSAGRLWTAFESSLAIRIGYTSPNETAFTFEALPVSAVTGDDLATVTAFGTETSGRKIGILWSDQAAGEVRFAWRHDGDPIDDAAWHIETAFGGGVGGCPTANASACGDDHLNVKVLGDELYVATKTSLDSVPNPVASDPLIALLHRDAAGAWSAVTVSPVSQHATRPILLLAPERDRVWVFATKGSGIVVWESLLSALQFDPAAFIPWIDSSSAGSINDATSTKQPIVAGVSAVVEASSESLHQYWHNAFLP